MGCRKWILFSLNLFIWFVTSAGLGICATIKFSGLVEFDGLGHFIKFDVFLIAMGLFFVVGLIAFLGLVGALRENVTLLKAFRICVSFFLLVELGCILIIVLFGTKAEEFLTEHGRVLIKNYDKSNHAQVIVDFFQITFKCCGANDIDQYNDLPDYSCNTKENESQLACGVPYSCCKMSGEKDISVICGAGVRKNAYSLGQSVHTSVCVTAIVRFVKKNLITLGILMGGLIIFQFVNIIICSTFTNDILVKIAQYKAKVKRLREKYTDGDLKG